MERSIDDLVTGAVDQGSGSVLCDVESFWAKVSGIDLGEGLQEEIESNRHSIGPGCHGMTYKVQTFRR